MTFHKKGRMYTKDEVETILKLWNTKTVKEIAEELQRPFNSIIYVAKKIRLAGYNLPKKYSPHKADYLIKTVLKEKGLID